MANLTRRGFFKQTSASVASLGILAAVPSLEAVAEAPEIPAAEVPITTLAGPLVAHISDLATGEVSVMVGTREIIYRDPELVTRLLKALQ